MLVYNSNKSQIMSPYLNMWNHGMKIVYVFDLSTNPSNFEFPDDLPINSHTRITHQINCLVKFESI